jgi:hypothetical protein
VGIGGGVAVSKLWVEKRHGLCTHSGHSVECESEFFCLFSHTFLCKKFERRKHREKKGVWGTWFSLREGERERGR